MKIQVNHIAKIEGHAGFIGEVINGNTQKARFIVQEGARFLEGIMRERRYDEVSYICARICGVCPVVHTLTSLKALEAAMNIKLSKSDQDLRKLLMLGQTINSHALHLFFFSLADFFGIEEDLKLIKKYPEYANDALAIREYGNKLIELIGGRSIHPLTPVVGGFSRFPNEKKLIDYIATEGIKMLEASMRIGKFFAGLNYPKLETNMNWASLTSKNEYAIYEGDIKTSDKQKPVSEFMEFIKEFQVPENPQTKRSHIDQKPFLVGALARLNNNHEQLNSEAKKLFKKSGLKLPSQNPFHNILAQVIEIVHCIEETQKIIIAFLDHINVPARITAKAGKGIAVIEAPRGTLYYYYEVGEDKLIKQCNIITPTAQNLARLEEDLKIWLPELSKLSPKEHEAKIRMLIRAYDPCLTCATH